MSADRAQIEDEEIAEHLEQLRSGTQHTLGRVAADSPKHEASQDICAGGVSSLQGQILHWPYPFVAAWTAAAMGLHSSQLGKARTRDG